MNHVNRGIVTAFALVGVVVAVALMLLPLPTLDMLQRSVVFLRSQALIYSTTTRVVAGAVAVLLIALVLAQLLVRRPTLVPVRNTGSGVAMLDLRTVQQAVNQVLSRSVDIKSGKAMVQGYSEGVAIYLTLELYAADYLSDTIAHLHESVRDDVENRLGVAILTLKSTVAGKPFPAPANTSDARESPREPAWDVRELRRRIERTILNQAGVADLECKIGYHADGASVFLQLFIEDDVQAPPLIARVQKLTRAIVEEDFELHVYDMRVSSQSVAV